MTVDRVLYRLVAFSLLVLCASLAWRYYSTLPHRVYEVGQRVDDLPEVQFQHHATTVIFWLNTRCQPCYDSIPLFQRITARANHTSVIAVGPDPESAIDAFVREAGLKITRIVSVGRRPIKLWSTPTILVVNQRGIVKAIHVGLVQKPDDENRILNEVN